MTLTTEITIDDHNDFQSIFGKRAGSRVLFLLGQIILLIILVYLLEPIIFLANIYLEAWQTDKLHGLLNDQNVLPWVIASFLLLPVAFYWIRWVVRSLLDTPKHLKGGIDESKLRQGYDLGPTRYEVLPAGINIKMRLDEEQFNWSDFQDLRETERSLFLMFDKNRGVLLPKRAFSSDREIQDFKALFARLTANTA